MKRFEFILQDQCVRGEGREYIVWSRHLPNKPNEQWEAHDHPKNDWTRDKRKAVRLMERLQKEHNEPTND